MNTFVLLGLAIVLALFLVRSRSRRATPGSSASPARSRGLRGRRSAPAPAQPEPAAPVAPAAFEPLPPAARPPDPAPRPSDWTPGEMIVEPGWPLPGEISGTWSGGPQATSSPVPTLETPLAASTAGEETAAAAAPAPLADPSPADTDAPPEDEAWEMPAIAPVAADGPAEAATEPVAPPTDAAPSIWVPGAVEDDATAWPTANGDTTDVPIWSPDDAPPAEEDPIWGPAAGVAASAVDPAPAPAPPTKLPIWRPETIDVPEPEAWSLDSAAPEPLTAPPMSAPTQESPSAPEAAVPDEAAAAAEPDVAEPGVAEPEPAWTAGEPLPEPSSPSSPEPLEDQCAEVASLVPAVLSALRPLTGVSDHVGITPRMIAVVRALAERPMSIDEQAGRLGVSRPVVADIAARLQRMGLARRERDERDRRRVRVVLTERGRRIHAETAEAPAPAVLAHALSRMDPSERDALVRGLRALSRSAST